MRQILSAAMFIVGAVAIAIPTSSGLARTRVRAPVAAADSIQDRYCLQGQDAGYPGNCEFSTYEQCRATASGTADGCGENPKYLFAEQRRGYFAPR